MNSLHRHYDTLHRHWIAKAQNDNEMGGVHFQRNLALAKKVVKRFGSKELMEVLERTRLGSHPELVRLLWKVGQALPPAKLEPKSIGELFYPEFKGNP